MRTDVGDGLRDVAGDDELGVDRELGIADRIEQVGKADDQRRLTQRHAIPWYRLHPRFLMPALPCRL
jgi:hypothetical protein